VVPAVDDSEIPATTMAKDLPDFIFDDEVTFVGAAFRGAWFVVCVFELGDEIAVGSGVREGIGEGEDVLFEEMDVEVEVFEEVLG